MRVGLSALYYIKNNKKRVSVLVVSIGLFITMIYGISFLFSATYESFGNILIEQPKKSQILDAQEYVTDEQLEETLSKIKSLENVDDTFLIFSTITWIESVVGQYGIDMPLLEKEQIKSYMDYMNGELIEGNMPQNKGEIILDEKIVKNKDFYVGQEINDTITLVGTVKSDYYFCCGINPNDYNNGILILSDGEDVDYNQKLNDMGVDYDFKVYDQIQGEKDYQKNLVDEISASVNIITIVSTIVLALCLIIVINMYVRDRHEEWCLYHSIGFSTQNIYLSALRELLLILLFAICFGAVIITGLVLTMDTLLMKPAGLLSTLFMPDKIYQIIAILVILLGVFQIPVFHAMNKIKTIDAIEDEDF